MAANDYKRPQVLPEIPMYPGSKADPRNMGYTEVPFIPFSIIDQERFPEAVPNIDIYNQMRKQYETSQAPMDIASMLGAISGRAGDVWKSMRQASFPLKDMTASQNKAFQGVDPQRLKLLIDMAKSGSGQALEELRAMVPNLSKDTGAALLPLLGSLSAIVAAGAGGAMLGNAIGGPDTPFGQQTQQGWVQSGMGMPKMPDQNQPYMQGGYIPQVPPTTTGVRG